VQKYFPAAGGKVVYPEMSRLDWKRRASFAGLAADPFQLTLLYPGPRNPCCLPERGKYLTYTVTGLKGILKQYNDTEDVVARFHLDANGFVQITGVEVSRVFNETEMVSKLVPDDSPPGAHPQLACFSHACLAHRPVHSRSLCVISLVTAHTLRSLSAQHLGACEYVAELLQSVARMPCPSVCAHDMLRLLKLDRLHVQSQLQTQRSPRAALMPPMAALQMRLTPPMLLQAAQTQQQRRSQNPR
jgi:hypothetical protein